ncbi:MAG: hypothetical protein NVSMB25_24770 [Thermoleophilaceae bacterium]
MEERRSRLTKRLIAQACSEQYGIALLSGSVRDADQAVRDALDTPLDEAAVYDWVIAPAMHRIGRLWASGEISVGHEHLATQITLRVLALLRAASRTAPARREHRAQLAAVEGERHTLALEMAGDLLEAAGYEVLLLGADVPVAAISEIARDHQASLLALTSTLPASAVNIQATIDAARGAVPTISTIVGGPWASEALTTDPRVVTMGTLSGVVDAADALLRNASLN